MAKKQIKEVIEEVKPEIKPKVKRTCSPQLLEQLKNMRELARIKRLEIGEPNRKKIATKILKQELNKIEAEKELKEVIDKVIKPKEEVKEEVKPKKRVIKKIIKYECDDDEEDETESEIEYIKKPSRAAKTRVRIESQPVEQPTPRDVDLINQSATDRLKQKMLINNQNNYMDVMKMSRY